MVSVENKANRSIIALGIRQVVVQGSNVLGTIIVARNVSTDEYGFFAVTGFFLTFLVLFTDVGLGASLIRQNQEPLEEEYANVFSFQQIIIGGIAILICLFTPHLNKIYHISGRDSFAFILLSLALFITTFQVIPQIKFERNLEFNKLSKIEIIQAIIYNISLIIMVLSNYGIIGFALAIVVRSLTGAIAINLIYPSKMIWRFNREFIRKNAYFSLAYQGSKLVSLIKDSISPIFIGILISKSAVGLVNWASLVSSYAVMSLSVLQRIYMPAFSRLQHDKSALRKYIEFSLRLANAVVAPLSVLTLVLIEPITKIIFGHKWLIALPAFYFFWLANLFVPTSTVLQGLLNSLGKSNIVFRFAAIWMFLTWIIGVPLIIKFGFVGFSIANFIVQLTNISLFIIAKRQIEFYILENIYIFWILSAFMGILIKILSHILIVNNVFMLAALILIGMSIYGYGIVCVFPKIKIKLMDQLNKSFRGEK